MKTLPAFATATRELTSPGSWRRWPQASTIVTALYVALVLAAPALVRFAPDADAPWVTAVTAEPTAIHCASTASWPSACQVSAVTVADASVEEMVAIRAGRDHKNGRGATFALTSP